jgi:LemA protein
MSIIAIIIFVLAVTVLAIVHMSNRAIGLANHVNEMAALIDVQLQRRFDLIPNLESVVAGYADHESKILATISEIRGSASAIANPYATAVLAGADGANVTADGYDAALTNAVNAVSESYPGLKASGQFLNLQDQLANTEANIAASRRMFDNAVNEYNTYVQRFPSSLVANAIGRRPMAFYKHEPQPTVGGDATGSR